MEEDLSVGATMPAVSGAILEAQRCGTIVDSPGHELVVQIGPSQRDCETPSSEVCSVSLTQTVFQSSTGGHAEG